ncbi:hypothetical protein EIK77_010062 [Talaromyces pinophilus]|nr:hypothetical protein EIK77_010062 [Talaromyces pinophilus]
MSALPLQNGFPDPRNVRPTTSLNAVTQNVCTSGPLQSMDNAFDASTWADVDPIDFSSHVANIAEFDTTETGAWDLGRMFDET